MEQQALQELKESQVQQELLVQPEPLEQQD